PSARPAPLEMRPLPPKGRRAVLRRRRPRACRLAHGLEGRSPAAPLATVHRADPRLQGDGAGVSAPPAAPPMALDRILPWCHNRKPQGEILSLGRPVAA